MKNDVDYCIAYMYWDQDAINRRETETLRKPLVRGLEYQLSQREDLDPAIRNSPGEAVLVRHYTRQMHVFCSLFV